MVGFLAALVSFELQVFFGWNDLEETLFEHDSGVLLFQLWNFFLSVFIKVLFFELLPGLFGVEYLETFETVGGDSVAHDDALLFVVDVGLEIEDVANFDIQGFDELALLLVFGDAGVGHDGPLEH